MRKILFVCKYNAFRSRVAEEYFNKINPKNGAISRGIIMGEDSDGIQRKVAKSLLGINIAKRKPLPSTFQDMKNSDLIVVVANDIPKIIFNYPLPSIQKKLVLWKIKDEQNMNEANIRKIVLVIKRRIDALIKKLQKQK